MFRISGNNIHVDHSEVLPGQAFPIKVSPFRKGQGATPISFIQYFKPLTPQHPYFRVRLVDLKEDSVVTIGIASLDISDNVHPGSWNNTVGYENLTGRCYSSHRVNANTLGRQVLKGDTFGILVTHFGASQSTVLFIHNDQPVATRYHFETDLDKFLPTISFENGPLEIEVDWQNAIEPDMVPKFVLDDKITWIRPSDDCCQLIDDNEFLNVQKLEDLPLQSPVPLSRAHSHYKCIQKDVSPDGQGASVGIASCSPLKPTPTCSLLRDYYTWLPKMKLKFGNSIGWGIFYDPNAQELNDKHEQLALVYVTFNDSIVDVLFVLQPEGGFYPLVLMQPWSKQVRLEMNSAIEADNYQKLVKLFNMKLGPASEIYNNDLQNCALSLGDMSTSSSLVQKQVDKSKMVVRIPASSKAQIHTIQYQKPLTPERRFFFIEINKLGAASNVSVGVAAANFVELNGTSKLPGQASDTVGYQSKSGHLFYNGKSHGNMMGHRCVKGDTMGVEVEAFDAEMSVVLFTKNFKPVGTRYLTLKDPGSFLPTIGIESSGEPIELVVYWHTVVSMPPHYNVRNPEDWCYPEGTKIDLKEKMFLLPHHYNHSLCLQAPYSLNHKYNHFELILIDEFDKNTPPPALALCTACPLDPPPISQFKQDYLRFWPTGDAMAAVKRNDRLGWGVFYVDENDDIENAIDKPASKAVPSSSASTAGGKDQLVICFLTINRQVVYLRVLFQPPGNFYPVVIAPPNVYRIKMDFLATRVSTQDFVGDQIRSIILDARKQIDMERRLIAQGKNPRDQNDDSKRSKMCTIL